jgi:hypothetical protein
MISKRTTLLLIPIFCANVGIAQEIIQTDRPDQTEGVFIVKKKSLQIEGGTMLVKNHRSSTVLLLPNTLFKYGIHEKLEAQLAFDVQNQQHKTGVLPISLGFKANLLKAQGYIPEISLIGRIQIKGLGSKAYAIEKNLPMFVFAFNNTVTSRYSIEYNLGMQWNNSEAKSYIFSVSNSYDVTDKIAVYVEAFNATKKNDFANAGFDFGGMFTMNKNWILDVGLGKYFDDDEQDYFVTVGFTTRLFSGD